MYNKRLGLIISFFFLFFSCQAQPLPTKVDFERAANRLYSHMENHTIFNIETEVNWFADSTGLWYIDFAKNKKSYQKVLFESLDKSLLFDHQKLSAALQDSTDENLSANNLNLESIRYVSANEMHFSFEGKRYQYDPIGHLLTQPENNDPPSRNNYSPDGQWEAFARDYNLYIRNLESEEEKQLTFDGTKDYQYASFVGWNDVIEGEDGERPHRFLARWSPDSRYLFIYAADVRDATKAYYVNYTVDNTLKPQLSAKYSGTPGQMDLVFHDAFIINTQTGQKYTPTFEDRSTRINSVSFSWSDHPDEVLLRRLSRGAKSMTVSHYDLKKDKQTTLYSEQSETNIDNFQYIPMIEAFNALIIISERSGWRQIYQLDLDSKDLIPITNGNFYVQSIEHIDEVEKVIYFKASGVQKDENPYIHHLYKINLDGTGLVDLTPDNAHHEVDISPDGQYFKDEISRSDLPTSTVLKKLNTGKTLVELTNADIGMLDDWQAPIHFQTKSPDGKDDLYGTIWRPSNFNPKIKYPILDYSYTGPQWHMFPNRFKEAFDTRSFMIAELGFIVVQVDGRGSSGRSKAFHDYSYKNLGNLLSDHIDIITAMAKKYDWMDIDRVGIFGYSAGGYDAARGVLAYPDFYKVGVASAGNHDLRIEKVWWPEMYMGWPVDSTYGQQANEKLAHQLDGKLLLSHGGMDRNVHPISTYRLAEALIDADKPFDMIIMPSQDHSFRRHHRSYFRKVKWNYFVQHLLGGKPVWDFKLPEEE